MLSPPAAAPTSTVVSCVPGSVTVNSGSVCTATVTDTSASPSTPTGSVCFEHTATVTLSPRTICNLLPGTAGTASCAVTYTPTVVGTGTHSITGTFFFNDTATTEIYALSLHDALPISAPTSTVVSCVPGSVTVNSGSVCTATVTDTSASPSTPTGS